MKKPATRFEDLEGNGFFIILEIQSPWRGCAGHERRRGFRRGFDGGDA